MPIMRSAKAVALFGSLFPAVVLAAVYVSSTKFSVGGQEQNVIFAIQTLLDGQDLYRDPGRMPFVLTQYTPIFYDLCFALCRGLGLTSGDLHGLYVTARMTSTVASLGCCFVMFAILTRYTRLDKVLRLTLAFLLPLAIVPWDFAARPDALYLLFVAAGLMTAMLYAETFRLRMLVASALLLLAAFYTKQTALFLFPLPFVVRFAREGWRALKPRDMLICLVTYGAGAVFMTPAMVRNFAAGLGNGIDLANAFWNVFLWPGLFRLPLLIAACIAARQAIRRGGDWPSRAIGLATIWFLLVGLVLSLKYGSANNYLDEFMVGCLLLIGMAPCLALMPPDAGRLALGLIGLIVAGQASMLYFSLPNIRSALASRPDWDEAGRALAADPDIRNKSVMVLNYWALLFIPDRAVFAPIDVTGSSAALGHYDLTPIIHAVHDGTVCFAVTDGYLLPTLRATPRSSRDPDQWMPAIGSALLANFHTVREIGPMVLLASDVCGQTAH
jgi:hypothetical protein